MTELLTSTPPLTAEQRRHLDESYRQAISLVKTLSKVLGYPCPIVDREERRRQDQHTCSGYAILKTDNT